MVCHELHGIITYCFVAIRAIRCKKLFFQIMKTGDLL